MKQPILIAHRGLTNGPDQALENNPDQILDSLHNGYHCEIDLWVQGSKLYLGHDEPQYVVDEYFLVQSDLWIHAKNLPALEWLNKSNLNYFWHQNDDFTLTSKGFIWTYPGKVLTENSVCVMPEWIDNTFKDILYQKCYGICSDFVDEIKEKILK